MPPVGAVEMPVSDMRTADRPLIDVLDRVLMKGIVILFDVDVSVAGLHVVDISGRTIVLSLETYTKMMEPPPTEVEASEALMDAVTAYLERLPRSELSASA